MYRTRYPVGLYSKAQGHTYFTANNVFIPPYPAPPLYHWIGYGTPRGKVYELETIAEEDARRARYASMK